MVSSNTETGISVTYDTTNDNLDFALSAAQTTITSLLATDIKIGEDDQTKVDFEDANTINFYADNTKRVSIDSTGLNIASGSLETATIDYTDGDVAITIADGGGVTNNVSLTLASGATVTAILDEDDLSSDSATALATQQSIKAYIDAQVAASGSGDITAVTFQTDTGSGSKASDTGGSADFSLLGGDGIGITNSGTTITAAVSAAQTTITSLLATDIKIGEDDQTKIDFETADEIHFYAANTEQVYLGDNIFGPQSDSDVDLGSSSVRWKDAYVDSITVTGEVDGASLDISGNADIDGTLEADAITVNGTALNEYIADTIGDMVGSNTESGITVAYQDSDNTLDFTVGTLNQDTTGNAATATALETARTIHGVSFDGTGNIDLTEVIEDTVGAMVSSNTESGITVAYQDGDGTLDFTIGTLNQDTTGSAATLTTARNIGGVSFDGSANIDLPGVNTSGNQDTSGTAANATHVTVADNESTDENNLITFIENASATGNVGLESDGDFHYNPSSGTVTATIFKGNIDAVDGDFDGTLEADAYTVAGTSLAEYIADTVGAMFSGNTETRITATYQDGDNTIDLVVDDLDTNTTYSAGTNISLSGTTFNVDDAFLKNDANDTTSGTITAGGFTTAGSVTTDTLVGNSNSTNTLLFNDDQTVASNMTTLQCINHINIMTDGNNNGTGDFRVYNGSYDADTADLAFQVNSSGKVNVYDDLRVPSTISHTGDTDTYISFTDNRIRLYAGGSVKVDTDDTYQTSGSAITLGGHTMNDIDIGSEFVDTDDHLMTSGAIKEKIESYGYTTNTGDMTGVDLTGANGIAITSESNTGSGAYSATVNLSHLGIEDLSDPNADRILIWDDSAGAVAWGTANTGLSISGTNINNTVSDTNTTYSAGTNISLSGTTFNVDDAFLKNDASDTMSGSLTVTEVIHVQGGDDFALGEVTNTLRMKGNSTNSFNFLNNGNGWAHLNCGNVVADGSIEIGGHSFDDIDIGSEFVDTDDHIMSSGAIKEKIESYGYVTTDTNTTYSAGTNISLSSTTFNVDDAFLINSGNDTTSGTITAAGFNTASGKVGDVDDEYIDFGTAGEIQFKIDNVEDFMMADGGTFHANADIIAYSSSISSDKKLKKNIKDVKYGLEDVLKLRGVEFDWKEKLNGKHDIGFIAQEIEEVVPELVKEVDGLNDEEAHLVVDYAKLVPVLVESIKELKEEIDLLNANLDQLKYNKR